MHTWRWTSSIERPFTTCSADEVIEATVPFQGVVCKGMLARECVHTWRWTSSMERPSMTCSTCSAVAMCSLSASAWSQVQQGNFQNSLVGARCICHVLLIHICTGGVVTGWSWASRPPAVRQYVLWHSGRSGLEVIRLAGRKRVSHGARALLRGGPSAHPAAAGAASTSPTRSWCPPVTARQANTVRLHGAAEQHRPIHSRGRQPLPWQVRHTSRTPAIRSRP